MVYICIVIKLVTLKECATLNFKIMDNLTLEVEKLKNGFKYT